MSSKQLKALMDWVDSLIDLKIAQDHGRNASGEWLRNAALEEELREVFLKEKGDE